MPRLLVLVTYNGARVTAFLIAVKCCCLLRPNIITLTNKITMNLETEICQVLKKHNLTLKKRESVISDLLSLINKDRAKFCLLMEQDNNFEKWVNNNFNKQGDWFVNMVNESVTYSPQFIIDLYGFYCDRTIVD